MGRRLRGRIRLLRGLALEVGAQSDCWSQRFGAGEWVAAGGMERRLGGSGGWTLGLFVGAGIGSPFSRAVVDLYELQKPRGLKRTVGWS